MTDDSRTDFGDKLVRFEEVRQAWSAGTGTYWGAFPDFYQELKRRVEAGEVTAFVRAGEGFEWRRWTVGLLQTPMADVPPRNAFFRATDLDAVAWNRGLNRPGIARLILGDRYAPLKAALEGAADHARALKQGQLAPAADRPRAARPAPFRAPRP